MSGCSVNVTSIPVPGQGTPSGIKIQVTDLPVGFQGLQGEQGIQGVAGADGKTWYSGTSTPSDSLGVDGDFYLNTTTDDVYKKVSGTWGSPLLNIKGAKGDQGDPGEGGTVQLNNYNSFTSVWKDNATITVKAGGQATTTTGTVTHTLAADTDLALPGGLDTGSEAANTKYYIWIGTVTGTVTLKFSLSATAPTGLTDPVLLPGCCYNNSSSNLVGFWQAGGWQFWDAQVRCAGSDVTEIFDGSVSTNFQEVSCALFVPAGMRQVLTMWINNVNSNFANAIIRQKGEVSDRQYYISTSITSFPPFIVDSGGIFELKTAASSPTTGKATLVGFSL